METSTTDTGQRIGTAAAVAVTDTHREHDLRHDKELSTGDSLTDNITDSGVTHSNLEDR